jgi:hypothetical protein
MRRNVSFARGAAAVLLLAAAAVLGHAGAAPASVPAHDRSDGHGSLIVRHDVAVDLATAGTTGADQAGARPERTTPAILPAAVLAGLALALCECVERTRRRFTRAVRAVLPGRRAPPLLAA